MYDLILRLIFISALAQMGIQLSEVVYCHSGECSARLEKASRDLLQIDWKPISVWPEEAKKFNKPFFK